MTASIAPWRLTYTPGQWLVLAGPNSVVAMMPPPGQMTALVEQAWVEGLQATSLPALLKILSEYGVDDLPDFTAFFWHAEQMHALARGKVLVKDAANGEVVVDGRNTMTWREETVSGSRQLQVVLDDGSQDSLQLPLMAGAVRASSFHVSTSPEDVVKFPSAEEVAETPQALTQPSDSKRPEPVADERPDSRPAPVAESSRSESQADSSQAEPSLGAVAGVGLGAAAMGTSLSGAGHDTEPEPAKPQSQPVESEERVETKPGTPSQPEASSDNAPQEPSDQYRPDEQAEGPVADKAEDTSAAPEPEPKAPEGEDTLTRTDSGPGQYFGNQARLGAVMAADEDLHGLPHDEPRHSAPAQQQAPQTPMQQDPLPNDGANSDRSVFAPPVAAELGQAPAPYQPGPGQISGEAPYGQGQPEGGRVDDMQGWSSNQPGPQGSTQWSPDQQQPQHETQWSDPSDPEWPVEDSNAGLDLFGRTEDLPAQPQSRGMETGGTVLAAPCPNFHPNDPSASRCRVCQAPVDSGRTAQITRPILAGVNNVQGEFVNIEAPLVIGRLPDASRAPEGGRVMQVNSPNSDISRSHLMVSTRGWDVVVTDLNSTNGTLVIHPGQQPFVLAGGDEVVVEIGTVLDLGDGVSLRIEPPQ